MLKINQTIFIFDVDSTLVKAETLEEIIALAIQDVENKEKILQEVKAITKLGMEGKLNFRESLIERFKTASILQKHLDFYHQNILPSQVDLGFQKVFEYIKKQGGQIYLVSGGFMDSIKIVAQQLKIDYSHCFANEFIIQGNRIIGFDEKNVLADGLGKVKLAQKFKQQQSTKNVICVGDGNSDFLIKKEKVADEFWGFWANVQRENLIKLADHNFYSSQEIFEYLKSNNS
jgi:D-3-phosphoglycerate dehydrogenase